jgi:hypothetical protein
MSAADPASPVGGNVSAGETGTIQFNEQALLAS